MSVVKVIVSDYRYFLFAIYDIRFTQQIDILNVMHLIKAFEYD